MDINYLIHVLEVSIKTNGDKPLTKRMLLNLLKKAKRKAQQDDYEADMMGIDSDLY